MVNLPETDELINQARRLIELGRLIVRATVEWHPQQLAQYLAEFAEIKTTMQKGLIERPLVQLPGVAADEVRAVVMKVASGQPLPVEVALSGGSFGDVLAAPLTSDDFEELGRDALYSWMNHSDYAQGLYRAGALIVACRDLPSHLERFLDEARQCFAFQQYNAVFAMCRAMLEISVKDVALECGLIPRDTESVTHLAAQGKKSHGPDLAQLITQITGQAEYSQLRDALHRVRQATNPIVHGTRSVTRDQAASALKDTLGAIHRLYEAHATAHRHAVR